MILTGKKNHTGNCSHLNESAAGKKKKTFFLNNRDARNTFTYIKSIYTKCGLQIVDLKIGPNHTQFVLI